MWGWNQGKTSSEIKPLYCLFKILKSSHSVEVLTQSFQKFFAWKYIAKCFILEQSFEFKNFMIRGKWFVRKCFELSRLKLLLEKLLVFQFSLEIKKLCHKRLANSQPWGCNLVFWHIFNPSFAGEQVGNSILGNNNHNIVHPGWNLQIQSYVRQHSSNYSSRLASPTTDAWWLFPKFFSADIFFVLVLKSRVFLWK